MTTPPKRQPPPPSVTKIPPAMKIPPATKLPPKPEAVTRPKKNFIIKPWCGENDGEKVLIYAESGMGKSTLASTSPNPVFIGLDDGGRKLKHPKTTELLNFVDGVESFYDVRDVLGSYELLKSYQTVVIDTITILQELAEPYIFDIYKLPKTNATATSLRQYGWGDGFGHLVESMRLILQDCDVLIRKGINIVMLAQLSSPKRANAGGEDFLYEGPDLYHDARQSVRDSYKGWADHILKIDYLTRIVGEDKKITEGDTTRAIFVKPETYFTAKSRTLNHDVISFSEPADNSLWTFMFPENK